MIWDNTFATDQPTDHIALTRYNDRNSGGPTVQLGHLSTFIMPSFASNNLIHIVSNDFGQKGQKLKLPIEPRGVIVTWPISKKLKILDILRLGQRRLGTPGMALVDWRVVCIGPYWCLEVSGTVYCWSGTTSLWHICHRPANRPFALTRYNDRKNSGPIVWLSHLSHFIMPSFAPK